VEIRDKGTADIFNGINSKAARKTCPATLHEKAALQLDQINNARNLADLTIPPGNKLHALSRDRKGQHAIEINGQFRICFRWVDGEALDVEIVDYH
jgi:proteic killer suppression protein